MSIKMIGWRKRPTVIAFVRWLETVMEIRHRVDLYRVDGICGYFDAPRVDADRPMILATDDEGVLDTIAHELCHYEQWRDKRKMTERGVAQRAAALVRRWRREG